jgi:putative phage-type endonuclease
MAQIVKAQNRAEWLKHREQGVGGSEVASILGLNPYETPYQLWRRKTGQEPPKEENFAMRAGHYLEDAVAKFWQDETGREVIKSSAGDWLYVNEERPFLRASPDRTYWLPGLPKNNQNKGIFEAKTTQKAIDPEDIPKHWFVQIQYQLGCAELTQGSLGWLCSGRSFDYKDISFVPDFYGWVIEEVEKFWMDNVVGGKEPALTTAEDIVTKYAKHTDGKVVEVGEEILSAYTDLKGVRAEIDALERRKEELEGRIKMGFGDAEAISYGGQTLATWKAAKESEKFDSKAFKSAHPDLAAQFISVQPGSRRFLLK